MGVTIGKAIPVHWVNTTYSSVDVIGSGGVYTGMGGSRTFRECKPGVNKLGQAGASITYTNDSNKEIKYIIFTVVPLDSVNSRLSVPVRLKETGPIKPHATKSCQWDYMWQAGSLKKIIVENVSIEYMDGTFEEQAAHPGMNQAQLQCDPAAGHSMTTPIVLSILALAFMVFSMRSNIRFIGLHIIFILLSLLTTVLSKKGNRIGSIISAIGALAAHTVSYFIPAGRVMANDARIVDEAVAEASSVAGNYRFPLDAGAVGIMVMCFLMILCAVGAIKENKKIVMPVAFGILCAVTIIPGVKELVQEGNAGGLFLSALYILFGALIWMVAIRCRHTLATSNGNTLSAKNFEVASEQHFENKRTETSMISEAPKAQTVPKESPTKETNSGKANNKILCKSCGAINNPWNEKCFACHARLKDNPLTPKNKADKSVVQSAKEEYKSMPEKQSSKQDPKLLADSRLRDDTAGKMHCPKCGSINDAKNESCVVCHTSFDLLKAFMETEVVPKRKKTVFCPKCGAVNDAENNQCSECNVSFELLKAFMDAGDSVEQGKPIQTIETTEPERIQGSELIESEEGSAPIVLPDEAVKETADDFIESELSKMQDQPAEIAEQNNEPKKIQIEKKEEEPVPAWFSEITKEHNEIKREIEKQLQKAKDEAQKLLVYELNVRGQTKKKKNEVASARREEELRQDELRKKLAEEDARYQAEIERRKQESQE